MKIRNDGYCIKCLLAKSSVNDNKDINFQMFKIFVNWPGVFCHLNFGAFLCRSKSRSVATNFVAPGFVWVKVNRIMSWELNLDIPAKRAKLKSHQVKFKCHQSFSLPSPQKHITRMALLKAREKCLNPIGWDGSRDSMTHFVISHVTECCAPIGCG